jgi:hypothetical protein
MNMSGPNDLELLLSHDDDGTPFLDRGLPADAVARNDERPEQRPGPEHLWDEGGDPNDLEAQRWGLVVPEGKAGDRLIELARPLIEARRAAQDGHEVQVFRAPPELDMAGAAQWRKTVFDRGADLAIELPRYLLVLGDLFEVPFALQQVLGAGGFVGRLAFSNESGYEAYIDKILRAERDKPTAREGRSVFFTVPDGTAATASGHRALMQPGLEIARRRKVAGHFPAREIIDLARPEGLSPTELLDAAAQPDPGVLFTISHGAGPPRGGWKSFADQRERQGAMSFGQEGKLTGSDIRARPFLPGGMWFMLACYGAGTPDTSAYRHWLERLQQIGQFGGQADAVLKGLPHGKSPPFVAALPRAALANPDGPLAFIGHIDLAWTYSFEERDGGGSPMARPARFIAILRSLLRGDRVGPAFRELTRFFEQANTELTSLYDRQAQGSVLDSARLAHLWMLRQDLAGYVLLGDPAARLPLARQTATERTAIAAPSAASVLGYGAAPQPAPPAVFPAPAAPPPLPAPPHAVEPIAIPMDFERLEEAIAHVLVGDRGLGEIAEEYGIDRAELRRLANRYRQGGRAALGRG